MNRHISGGISGAITDPFSDDAVRHAEMYYEEIRKNHADVDRIARNAALSRDQVLLIKQYLFLNVHDLEGGTKRFDPSFEIAQSWQRLAFDPEHVQPHDLTLLKHELKEISLVNQGLSQHEAHIEAAREFPYGRECKAFYEALEGRDKPAGGQLRDGWNGGAIAAEDYDMDGR